MDLNIASEEYANILSWFFRKTLDYGEKVVSMLNVRKLELAIALQ